MLDWPIEIRIAILVKQKLYELDVDELWPLHLPEAAATAEELAEAERAIGHKLASQQREFLKFANGWKAFFHCIDLFGTKDYEGSESLCRANEL